MSENTKVAWPGLVALVCLPLSVAQAHTTISKKNTPSGYGERAEREGSASVFNSFSIPHGCASAEYPEPQPVTAMA
jgi:hypothetical protein